MAPQGAIEEIVSNHAQLKKLQRADLLCAHARAHWVTISNLEKLTNWMSIFEISLLKVTGDADYGMFFLGHITGFFFEKGRLRNVV